MTVNDSMLITHEPRLTYSCSIRVHNFSTRMITPSSVERGEGCGLSLHVVPGHQLVISYTVLLNSDPKKLLSPKSIPMIQCFYYTLFCRKLFEINGVNV